MLPVSMKKGAPGGCPTSNLNAVVINSGQSQKLAVGSIVLAIVLLALDLPATGLLFLLLTGLLVAAFALLVASVVCLIRCLSGCNR